MTVAGCAFSRIWVPSTAGLPPNRRCQKPSLNSTTGGASGWSSSALMVRPNAGATPSVGKKPCVTLTPPTRSASPAEPATVNEPT